MKFSCCSNVNFFVPGNSLCQMWQSISVAVWHLCRPWCSWSFPTSMCFQRLTFFPASVTLTSEIPSLFCKISFSLNYFLHWMFQSHIKSAAVFFLFLMFCCLFLHRWIVLGGNFRFLDPDARLLLGDLNQQMAPRFARLNQALAELVCSVNSWALLVELSSEIM